MESPLWQNLPFASQHFPHRPHFILHVRNLINPRPNPNIRCNPRTPHTMNSVMALPNRLHYFVISTSATDNTYPGPRALLIPRQYKLYNMIREGQFWVGRQGDWRLPIVVPWECMWDLRPEACTTFWTWATYFVTDASTPTVC